MKKRAILLRTLVVLILLTTMILSTLLGVTKAEYFKSFKKKLDLEMSPDMKLEYYLYDSNGTTVTTFKSTNDTYKSSKSFKQQIIIGNHTNSRVNVNGTNKFSGSFIIYQIKIPVDEAGYYTLDFNVRFRKLDSSGAEAGDFSTLSADYCVGCEIYTATDWVVTDSNGNPTSPFGVRAYQYRPHDTTNTTDGNNGYRTRISDNIYTDHSKKSQGNQRVIYSDYSASSYDYDDSVYQWKTLAPFRAENVSLSFKATEDDVENGYVIWTWDLIGLEGANTYNLYIDNLSVEKNMELDGTTKYRGENDPYFMFPQTAYVNNMVEGTSSTASGYGPGTTRPNSGRGTFITNATDNSLTMRTERIFRAQTTNTSSPTNASIDNPLSLYIPLKNVKYNTNYKVTFDFSIARQGSTNSWVDYSDDIFKRYTDTNTSDNTIIENQFRSYLAQVSNLSTGAAVTNKDHHGLVDDLTYDKKAEQGKPLTKYDEVADTTDMKLTTSTSVNDTFSQSLGNSSENTTYRNFFNAVWHTEYNGQNEIKWLTFYNTTFSFNIQGSGYSVLEDLYWIWNIDALGYTRYFQIKIENVRIQEVVDYGSNLYYNGFRIGNTQIDPLNENHVPNAGQGRTYTDEHDGMDEETGRDVNAFANFKGRNGTGQNFRARAYGASSQYFVKGNIYAPIVDASAFNASAYGGSEEDAYKIYLEGWAVVKGGVRKYVFSVDGGKTWEDMTFLGGDATATILADAEANIDQHIQGQSTASGGTEWITFTEDDALNGDFDSDDGKALYANLKDYAGQGNLDIIIAAVPASNVNLRCEIIRVINYNPIRNYRTYTTAIISDITVRSYQGTDINSTTGSSGTITTNLSAYYNGLNGTTRTEHSENIEAFTRMFGVWVSGNKSDAGGYALRTSWGHDWEDMRALFYDFPVYDTLSIAGWAMVDSGIEQYYWTADGGETWQPCDDSLATSDPDVGDNLGNRGYWYDGETTEFESGYNKNRFFLYNSTEKKYESYISADLTKYIGEVVDVIFAAKPIDSDVYVPVGRIDNVGVYGKDGTFHTRIEGVYFDGTSVAPIKDSHDGSSLARRDKWFLDFAEPSYSIYEPYNVNAINTRIYNDVSEDATLPTITSGGEVWIDGYTLCKSGIRRYKFSLDGGESWSVIYDNAVGREATSFVGAMNAEYSFTDEECLKSDYDNSAEYLKFNLPALEHGTVKDLLVVAEGNNDKLYPVLKIRFQVTDSNFGYFLNDADGPKTGQYTAPGNNGIQQYFTTSSDPTDTRYKLTLPVTETGMHYLNFDADLDYVPLRYTNIDNPHSKTLEFIKNNPNTMVAKNYETNDIIGGRSHDPCYDSFWPAWRFGQGTVGISTSKTQYAVGETLTVDYDWNLINYRSFWDGREGETRPAVYNAVIVLYPKEHKTGDYTLKQHPYQVIQTSNQNVTALNPKPTDTLVSYVDNKTYKYTYSKADKSVFDSKNNGHSANFDLTNLEPGEYEIVLYNFSYSDSDQRDDIDYVFDNAPWDILTEPITITINESIDNTISNQIMHDEGVNKYFADNGELASTADNRVAGVPWTNYNHLDPKKVEHYFDVTEEDVKRGYIVLDWNLTDLQANTNYVLNLTNIVFESGFRCIHHYVNGFCIKCGQKQPFVLDGAYIYYGDYPQTLKADNVTIDENNVDANNYYLGSDGKRYAKVDSSNAFSGGEYTFSTGEQLSRGETYYFKVEPIRWRIVKTEGNVLTLICDSIIDNGIYHSTSNDYENSSIRNWFKNDFLYSVFDKYQRALIVETDIGDGLTTEKVYLPSYADVTNPEYGFSNDPYNLDEARRLNTTDYARAKGAWISLSDWENYYGKGIWMLRTPSTVSDANIRECTHTGEVTDGSFRVNMDDFGVAPMVKIDISEEFESGGVIPTYHEVRVEADASGKGGGTIKIPVYEPGTYNFSYSTYVDTNVGIRHTGLNQTRHYAANGLNFQGSYLSVEKSVYAVGEPIVVDYFSTTSGSEGDNPPLFRNTWIGITRVLGDGNQGQRREKWIYYKYVPTNQEGTTVFYGNMPDGGKTESGAEQWQGLPAGTYKIYYRNDSANVYHDDPRNDISNDNGYFYWEDYNITMPITITVVDTAQDNASTTITSFFDDVNVRNSSSGTSYAPVFGSISIPKNTFYADETINFSLTGNVSKHGSNFMIAIYQNDMNKASTLVDSASESISLNGLSPGKYKIYYLSNKDGLLQSLYCGGVLACIDITILPTSAKNPNCTVSDNAGGVHTITTYNVKNHNYEFTVTEVDAERGYIDIPIEFTGLAPNTDCILVMDSISFTKKTN